MGLCALADDEGRAETVCPGGPKVPQRHRLSPHDRDALLRRLLPIVGRAAAFSGWKFDDPASVRRLDTGPAWDYEKRARERMRVAARAVDLGTGGGEVLERVAKGQRTRVLATEEWGVNAPVAAGRLTPLGIPVVRCSSERLPFDSASFDLVLSRHEAIEPHEVDRVLAPSGVFLTQQVAPDFWPELRPFFPRMTAFPQHDERYSAAFRDLGYEVSFQRCSYRVAIPNIETLAYRLLITPWTIPGFSVERDLEALARVEAELRGPDGIVLTEGVYLLESRKP